MADNILEEIESVQYSDEVKDAVRYGYQYRKAAEEHAGTGAGLHFILPEATTILYWLANLVVTGIAYDLIKKSAKALWNKLMSMKVVIPDDVNKVLIEDDELWKFVTWVQEFKEKKLSATEDEVRYIREEIMADYVGNRAGELNKRENRPLTHEEWKRVIREAVKHADELLKG